MAQQDHQDAVNRLLTGGRGYGRLGRRGGRLGGRSRGRSGARGGSTSIVLLATARGDAASLVDLVRESVSSGDMATAAIAMNAFFNSQRDDETASPLSRDAIPVFASIMNSDSNSADGTLSTIQDLAVFFLVQQLHVEEERVALAQSPLSVADHLNMLKSKASDVRSKLLAVLRLAQAVDEELVALEIVSCGAVPALFDSIHCGDDSSICVSDLRKQSAHLLETLPHTSARVREQIMTTDGVALLVLLHQSRNTSHKATALNALRAFLREESHTMQHESKQDTPILKILTTLLVGHDDATNRTNRRVVVDCDGGITFLIGLFTTECPSECDDIAEFTQKMSDLIPLLISRLQDNATKKLDTLVVVLAALEIFSRIRENQSLFQRHKGINQLVDLLRNSKDDDVRIRLTRILTNVSYMNSSLTQLIVEHGAVEPLATMVKSSRSRLQTSALQALRNLASNDENRARIGSLGLFPLVVKMASSGMTIKQKEAAAAVLGALSVVRANREQFVAHGGIGALLSFLRAATTPHQVATAAAALWVVVNAQRIRRLLDIGGITVLQNAVEGHQSHELHWANRLCQRLTSAATS